MKHSKTTALALVVALTASGTIPWRGAAGQNAAPDSNPAQPWNSSRALALATRATQRRAAQLADTALRNYKAEARGYLTFLAQLGEGFTQPPKVVKTDQIASDIYWRAPSYSKQLIKGRRDTLLLPTDIHYHRDHLGIVQNNFPNIIRLGDGDEVEDVPHPLSAEGLRLYDFALRDSLQIQLGPRTLNVYEVRVRPKDEHAPRAVGAVYIDRESGEVVRMTLSFTRSALKDASLVDVSVVLENGLIDGRFWLPRTQEIEIRRAGTWLDYPMRGIIRGRWEISDYEVNAPFAVDFNGPEIQAAPGATVTSNGMVQTPAFKFNGGILDSLPPDVKAASDADVQRVQEEARSLVRAQSLARARTLALAGTRVSDFVHANRVEGMAFGGGLTQGLGNGMFASAHTMYGVSDHRWKGRALLSYTRPSGARWELSASDELRDASIVAERSGVINSLASQNFGSDYTDLFHVRSIALSARSATVRPIQLHADVAIEREDSVSAHATPENGTFERAFPATLWRQGRVTVGADIPAYTLHGWSGIFSAHVDGIRGHRTDIITPWHGFAGGAFTNELTRDVGTQQLVLQTMAAAVSTAPEVPAQRLPYLGGPITAPGYDFHTLVGTSAFSQRLEWRFKVPFVSIPLGAWGRTPASLTMAPFVNAAWTNRVQWRPSVGLGALTMFELFRADVARGLRDGRWSFNLDVSRAFWSVL